MSHVTAEPSGRRDAPRVLITRGMDRAGELVDLLRRHGVEPVLTPLSEAALVSDEDARGALAVLRRRPFDAVTFTSAYGVWGLHDVCGRAPEPFPMGEIAPIVWCVGGATRAAAVEAGLDPVEAPATSSGRGMVEDRRRVLGNEGRRRVLCVRGRPARTELVEGLRADGHDVVEAVVYERRPYPVDRPLIARTEQSPDPPMVLDRGETAEFLVSGGASAVIATSPKLVQTVHSLGPVSVPVVCIGSTTEAAAQALGLTTISSEGTTPQDLVRATTNLLSAQDNEQSRSRKQ